MVDWKVYILAGDNFLDQWDSITATLREEAYGPQGELWWKINLIWAMRVSWWAYELFSQPLKFIAIWDFKIFLLKKTTNINLLWPLIF